MLVKVSTTASKTIHLRSRNRRSRKPSRRMPSSCVCVPQKNEMWCLCCLILMKIFLSWSAQPELKNLINESNAVLRHCRHIGYRINCGEKVNVVVVKVNVLVQIQHLLSYHILKRKRSSFMVWWNQRNLTQMATSNSLFHLKMSWSPSTFPTTPKFVNHLKYLKHWTKQRPIVLNSYLLRQTMIPWKIDAVTKIITSGSRRTQREETTHRGDPTHRPNPLCWRIFPTLC